MEEKKKNIIILERKRIGEELEKIFDTGLFIVTAQMGYGKTTEVSEFLRKKKKVKTIHVSADFGADDDKWLCKKVCTAISNADSNLGKEIYSIIFPKDDFDIDNIIEALYRNIKSETVIVCDDWHNAKESMANRIIERIAFEKIPHFHIVLITRKGLSNRYLEYELKNKCIVLGQENLTFTKNEIGELFEINKLKFNEDNIEEIYEYTCGWTLAIYLLAESYDSEEVIEYNLSKCVNIMQVLSYKSMSDKEKSILIKLSLLDEFSIKQAVYITEEDDSERIIKSLQEENLFIHYDSYFQTYKFHKLFKTMLKGELQKTCINEVKVYDKWIMWCIENKKYIKIIEKIISVENCRSEEIKSRDIMYDSFINMYGYIKSRQHEAVSEDFEVLSFNSILSKLHKINGKMEATVRIAQKYIIDLIKLTDGCGFGLEYLINGEYLYLTGKLKEAEECVNKALLKSEKRKQHSIYVCAYFLLMKILWSSGDRKTIYIKINKLNEYLEMHNIKKLKSNIDLAGAYLYGLLGKNDKIPDWIRKSSINLYNTYKGNMESMFNVMGVLLLLEERYSELKALSKNMLEKYIKSSNIIGQVYAFIFDAASRYKLNEIDSAVEVFIKAVKLARKDNIIMPFIELSGFINNLIEDSKCNNDFMNSTAKNIAEYNEAYYEIACEEAVENNHSMYELTERENEVMKLICSGQTQNDIAERLHLSINTVRYHLKNIYGKLDVNNKTLAIEKYKRMGGAV